MRWCGLWAVLVAACGSSVGAELEIHADVRLERVELYVANQVCRDTTDDGVDSCMGGIAWSPDMKRPPGYVMFMRDPLVVDTAELLDPKTAAIRLEVAGSEYQPLAIAIVGYAGGVPVATAELFDIRIPRSSAVHWRVHLDPATAATADITTPPAPDQPEQRVKVWPRRGGDELAGCAVFQQWQEQEGEWKSHFYGPADDPDCDDHEVECDPYWYDRNVGSVHSCVYDETPGAPGGCRLGATPCRDGESSMTACADEADYSSSHCFHEALCSQCEGALDVEACVIAAVSAGTVAGYACTFTPSSTSAPCLQANQVQLALPPSCVGGESYTLRLLDDDPLGRWSSGTKLLDIGGGVIIEASIVSAPTECTVTLFWKQGQANALPAAGVDVMLDVWYYQRHLFLPVHIDFATPQDCNAVGTYVRCNESGGSYDVSDTNCYRP